METTRVLVRAAMLCLIVPTTLMAEGRSNSRPPGGIEEIAGRLPAPKTQFSDENARGVTIQTFDGKIVVLNLWATWCAPCIKEMPSLNRLSKLLPAETFAVVAISQDRGGVAIAKPFLNRIKVDDLPVYVDPSGRVARALGIRGFPTTVLIGRDGTLLAKLEGAIEWDGDEVVKYLFGLSKK